MAGDILTTRDLVQVNAEKYPDTPFVNFYDEIITCRDLDEKTDAFANYLLESGIQKGDIVSFMMGNTPYFFYTLLGTQKIGANGIDVSIFDEAGEALAPGEIGEIVVRGATVMKGYFNNPEATAETIKNGWLYTGDVGYLDEDGFLFIVDRKKDMIIRGGVNIYPKELENVLATHSSVDQVAVIPEAHEKYGQVPKACIVVKRGESLDSGEMLDFCQSKMADYKVPQDFVFRASLPTNAVGKVVKKDLIRELETEETAEAVPVAHFFEEMAARFIPEKARGVDASVSYHITGKGGGQWTISIKDGKMTLTQEILKDPTVFIVAGDAAYYDIVTGKLDGITAVVTGKMQIEGDLNFMAQFREMFRPL